MNKKIKVLVHPSDRTGVSYFRSTRPHIALEEMFPDDFHIDIDYDPKYNDAEFLKQYDIVHYHRTFGPYEEMSATTATLKSLGIKGIMDLDDYWSPGTHHPAYLIIKENGLDKKLVDNIKLAEYVMTTTPIFAKEMNKFNLNTLVVPNAIDPTEKQYISNPEPSDRIRIGWLGGSSHLRDLEILKGVVSRLKTEGLMDKVQFVLCGFDTRGTITTINQDTKEQQVRKIQPHESVWTKYEQIFTDDYSTVSPEYKAFLLKYSKDEWPNIANEPYRRVWTKPISTYATNYNLFDISLAPLEENIFNKVKSQLKVIEAGFHKKALIAQNYGPYQIDCVEAYQRGGTISPNGNAFLIDSVKNHKEWYELIKRLIKNPDLIPQLANNLYNTVKDTYSIEATTRLRADVYKKLLNR
jgi:glycosyltransferase involved in cell wall biosynthesis